MRKIETRLGERSGRCEALTCCCRLVVPCVDAVRSAITNATRRAFPRLANATELVGAAASSWRAAGAGSGGATGKQSGAQAAAGVAPRVGINVTRLLAP